MDPYHFIRFTFFAGTVGSRDDVLELRRYYQQSRDPELIARCEARMRGEVDVAPTSVNGGKEETGGTTEISIQYTRIEEYE